MLAMEHSCRLPHIEDIPTMIFGMDVSHSGQLDIPSIAAVSLVWFECFLLSLFLQKVSCTFVFAFFVVSAAY